MSYIESGSEKISVGETIISVDYEVRRVRANCYNPLDMSAGVWMVFIVRLGDMKDEIVFEEPLSSLSPEDTQRAGLRFIRTRAEEFVRVFRFLNERNRGYVPPQVI